MGICNSMEVKHQANYRSCLLLWIFPDFHVVTIIITCLITATGCGQSAPDYFPLGNELEWEYSIQQIVNNEKSELKLIIANLQGKEIDDILYYPRKSASGHIYYFHKTPEAIYHSDEPGSPDAIVLKYPLEQGVKWRSGSGIYILERRHESFAGGESFISLDGTIFLDYVIKSLNESVEVPAGRFANCVRIEASGSVHVNARTRGVDHIVVEQTDWYAPDVGLVKSIRKEFTVPDKINGEMVQELVSIKQGW